MKKRIIVPIISIALLVLIASTGFVLYNNGVIFPKTVQAQKVDNVITYKGKDGSTALALLQKVAKVEISGTGNMAFVVGINGKQEDLTKKQYWAFYVNGKTAAVGAGSYITKNSDTIVWKLSSY